MGNMIKTYNTFAEYMQDVYYNDIADIIKKDLIDHKNRFENDDLYDISYVELEGINVVGVTFEDKKDDAVEIRASVHAEIALTGKKSSHYRETVPEMAFYCIFYTAVLRDGLKRVRFQRLEQYEQRNFSYASSLDRFMIPYIREEDIEERAEGFLRDVDCLKPLLEPMAVPAVDLARSLGMKLYYAPLDDDVFGKTYFDCVEVEVYDTDIDNDCIGKKITIVTEPGTMLINPDTVFMRNIGSKNNTIIHECVHWKLHRRAFELQKILNGELDHISCGVSDEKYEGHRRDDTAIHWMEWQANQLAPRILMPRQMTIRKFAELWDIERQHAEPDDSNAVIFERAVDRLAEFFMVSRVAAKLRLIELGQDNAEGAFPFSDGRYLPPYFFKKGTLKFGQTFLVDEFNAFRAILSSKFLRDLFADGKIVYVNSMVCLNLPGYIEYDDEGGVHLSKYAVDHVDECCFVFNRKYNVGDKDKDTFYRRCFLCREVSSADYIEADYDPEHEVNQSPDVMVAEIQKVKELMLSHQEVLHNLKASFGNTLSAHMSRKSITNEELAARTYIAAPTISNYRNDKNIDNITLATALKLCNGLKLHRDYSHDFMKKAGHDLDDTARGMDYWVAKHLVDSHMDDTIEQWQEKIDMFQAKIKLL